MPFGDTLKIPVVTSTTSVEGNIPKEPPEDLKEKKTQDVVNDVITKLAPQPPFPKLKGSAFCLLTRQLFESKQYNIAIAYFNKRVIPECYDYLGLCYSQTHHHHKALEAWQMACSLDKEESVYRHNLGTEYFNLKNYEEAISCIEVSLELAKAQEIDLDYYIGKLLLFSLVAFGKERAIEYFNKYTTCQKDTYDYWCELGCLLSYIDLTLAKEFLGNATAKLDYTNPIHATSWGNLGWVYEQLGEVMLSQSCYIQAHHLTGALKYAMKIRPKDGKYGEGEVIKKETKVESSYLIDEETQENVDKKAQEILNPLPGKELKWYCLSAYQAVRGENPKFDHALQCFLKAIPQCYAYLGWAQSQVGDHKVAIQSFSVACKYDKGNYLYSKHLGIEHLAERNIENALFYFTEAVEHAQKAKLLIEKNRCLTLLLVATFDSCGKEAMIKTYGLFTTHLPTQAAYWTELAELVSVEDHYSVAVDFYLKAASIDDKNAKTFSVLGWLYFQIGDFKNANEHYDWACELDPMYMIAGFDASAPKNPSLKDTLY